MSVVIHLSISEASHSLAQAVLSLAHLSLSLFCYFDTFLCCVLGFVMLVFCCVLLCFVFCVLLVFVFFYVFSNGFWGLLCFGGFFFIEEMIFRPQIV